ncbi:MAG: nicotinate-nucleotide adenylyltransferase [Methylotenera sp.]|nr:nicotinate-nucleotide adenylyltransferase [Methylotenera sp.]
MQSQSIVKPITKQVIGLLGGTFNPIHFGHLRMAQELAESLNLDEVRFIPSASPPHKLTPLVSAEQRAAMVQLAIANNPLFRFDGRELHRMASNNMPSYTIDTLQSLRNELGENISLVLFMGSDAFSKFNTWHRWDEIISLCHIALVHRPLLSIKEPLSKVLEAFLQMHYTENVNDLHEATAGYITMQPITLLDISSTVIRNKLQKEQSMYYLTPDCVINYIESNALYHSMTQ